MQPYDPYAAADPTLFNLVTGWLLIIVGAAIVLLFYFMPTYVAKGAQHPSQNAIMILNIFLGWTIIFWIICLAWAFNKPK